MGSLFVDTSGLYAAADRSDKHHRAAAELLRRRQADLVTSDYVLVESWLLLRARLGRAAAMRLWSALRAGAAVVAGATEEDLARAWKIAHDWPDQAFSLVDCSSFAIMERLDIYQVLAFDRHFRIYRFGPRRQLAFQVIPS